MPLPSIDFAAIAQTAKDALAAYGSPAQFFEGSSATGRDIRAVIYRDESADQMVQDADSMPATAILNPDDFAAPNRLPKKFDKIRISIAGFTRTYTIESVSPILASATLPLILVQLRAN